jgi:hypothetical protein
MFATGLTCLDVADDAGNAEEVHAVLVAEYS